MPLTIPLVTSYGSSGQVLTSNGAGTAPTFQDAAGGSTKEFFVPAIYNQASASIAYATVRGNWPLTNQAANVPCNFAFFVPNDFTSISAVKIVMIPDATETIQWDFYVSFGAVGEAYNNVANTDANRTQAVTVDVLTEVDVTQGSVFSGLAANDYVACLLDSNTSNIRILGLRFKYT